MYPPRCCQRAICVLSNERLMKNSITIFIRLLMFTRITILSCHQMFTRITNFSRDKTRGIHMDSVKLICIQVNICESTLVLSTKG
eukprot:SAG22_NODE_557_length_9118_cov_9.050006_2_plen_85_part_00